MLQSLSDFLYIGWLADFVIEYSWFWPICEMVHFIGLALLVGITGIFDLRLLGFAKSVPVGPLHKLIPWGIFGFVLCLLTGIVFVSGNVFKEPLVLMTNLPFQMKMLFMVIAGINVGVFYMTDLAKQVEAMGPGDDAPAAAKVIAGVSLFSWIVVMYFGRMIPWEDAILWALGI